MPDDAPALPRISIDKLSPIPIYHQAYLQIMELIEQGELTYGQRLPSEYQLAAHLDINRMTARKIYGSLDEKGLLYRVAGKGTFLKSPEQMDVYKEGKRTRNIGFLLFLKELDPFFADVLKGIESVLSARGYNLILKLANRGEENSVREIISRKDGIDGLIWTFLDYEKARNSLEEINRQRIPLVMLESYLDGANNDFVGIDFPEYNYKLTRALIARGRRRILFYNTGHEYYAYYMQSILKAFRRAVNESDLDPSECTVISEILTMKQGKDLDHVVDRIIGLRGTFDALLFNTAYADPMACLKLLKARDGGILSQIDIGIILAETWHQADFEGIPVLSDLTRRDYHMGRMAGRRIIERVESNGALKPSILLVGEDGVSETRSSYMIRKNKAALSV